MTSVVVGKWVPVGQPEDEVPGHWILVATGFLVYNLPSLRRT